MLLIGTSFYLIPAFSVAISHRRLDVILISITSLGLVLAERLLESWGAPLLMRAYQGGILIVLALCAPVITSSYHRIKYSFSSKNEARIKLHVSGVQ